MIKTPVTYLITFACYGCHLHGDGSGSVDQWHNLFGGRLIEPDAKRALTERRRMSQAPYHLDQTRRNAVLAGIREPCAQRRWSLLAAHVRTDHITSWWLQTFDPSE